MAIIGPADGIDQPILEKENLAIFETADGFVLRQEGEGDVMELPDLSDAMIEELKKDGWKEVDYA